MLLLPYKSRKKPNKFTGKAVVCSVGALLPFLFSLLISWRVIFWDIYRGNIRMCWALANKILWTMINKEIHFPLFIITNSTWNSFSLKDHCHLTIKVLFFHTFARFNMTELCERNVPNFMQSFIHRFRREKKECWRHRKGTHWSEAKRNGNLFRFALWDTSIYIIVISLCAMRNQPNHNGTRFNGEESRKCQSVWNDECWHL